MVLKNRKISVQGRDVGVSVVNDEDYICLTDMIKGFDGGDELLKRWIQNRSTVEFLGIWEEMHNPIFNLAEFHQIKTSIGLNSYVLSFKKWSETGAIGVISKAGRYGGTYAHRDIAFEFGSWLSPEFKLYLIQEFQRLKEQEAQTLSVEWIAKRELAKINYHMQTDAIQQNLLLDTDPKKHGLIYATEADMLNAIVFGKTAKQWKLENPELAGNQRDYASVIDNVIIANLEAHNARLIESGFSMMIRAKTLTADAYKQRESLSRSKSIKRIEAAERKTLGDET